MSGITSTKELAAYAMGGVAAAESKGYRWDALNETWRRSDSFATTEQFVMKPGTTFVDILPSGEIIQDNRALNPMETERHASGWAQNAEKERLAHEEWTRQQREIEAVRMQEWERSRTQGPVIHPQPDTVQQVKVPMSAVYLDDPNRSWTGAILGGIGGFLTGGPGGALIGAGVGAMGGYDQPQPGQGSGGGYTGATVGYNPGYGYNPAGYGTGQATCPPGYALDNQGRCAAVGLTGWMQQHIPGGQTGYLPAGQPGTAVGGWTGAVQQALPGGQTGYNQLVPAQGAFGVGALPAQMSQRKLVCPPGMVLGRDSVCYARRQLSRAERKHPPERKPLLSAYDGKVLERAHALEQKLNRVAGRFLAPPRPTAKKKGRGRARRK